MARFIELKKFSPLMELEEVETEIYVLNIDHIAMMLPTKEGTCISMVGENNPYLHVQESYEEIQNLLFAEVPMKTWTID
jgi:hypothetical protein